MSEQTLVRILRDTEEDSLDETQKGNSRVGPSEEERQTSGQEDREEIEMERAVNLQDLFHEEEDSLDGMQEESSRVGPIEEERQMRGQEVKEEMDLKKKENSTLEAAEKPNESNKDGSTWRTLQEKSEENISRKLEGPRGNGRRICQEFEEKDRHEKESMTDEEKVWYEEYKQTVYGRTPGVSLRIGKESPSRQQVPRTITHFGREP
ncbi:golgin subfamily A member 6-like protein 6 [Palaemon carinicauda]|uniref:golgin subfamily A member 6-like protein 6 n=1 Tax=Palaemon carinicauda TaxID=392227 RepID=UPI0035B642FF